jgi:hypothetical protein
MTPAEPKAALARRLHAVLYDACGLDAPPLDYSAERLWFDALLILDGLAETPAGPITARDIIAVVGSMRESNRTGKTNWSIRPTKILRDPELLRDLILESRRKLRPRRPPVPIQSRTGDGAAVLDHHDPATDAPAEAGPIARAELDRIRAAAGLPPRTP